MHTRGVTIERMLTSFLLALRAEGRAQKTCEGYTEAVRQFVRYCNAESECGDRPVADVCADDVRGFLVSLIDAGKASSTVAARHKALRAFFAWAVAERELDTNPMTNVKRPTVTESVIRVLSTDEVRALLAACKVQRRKPNGEKTYVDKRDYAVLSLMFDTGLRVGEVVALDVADVDLPAGVLFVKPGKTKRSRVVSLGDKTCLAIDRWLRIRVEVPNDALFLTRRNGRITKAAIEQMVPARAKRAGIGHVHPHVLRHSFAHAALSAGMTEGDVMSLGGWRSRTMLDRYGAARAEERARAAHRKASPLDRLGR